MVLTSLDGLSDGQKEELVASLGCLLIGDNDLTAEKLSSVAEASGNTISDVMASLFVSVVTKAPKGIETFTPPPGGGGGGGGWVMRQETETYGFQLWIPDVMQYQLSTSPCIMPISFSWSCFFLVFVACTFSLQRRRWWWRVSFLWGFDFVLENFFRLGP